MNTKIASTVTQTPEKAGFPCGKYSNRRAMYDTYHMIQAHVLSSGKDASSCSRKLKVWSQKNRFFFFRRARPLVCVMCVMLAFVFTAVPVQFFAHQHTRAQPRSNA